jgi:Putative zinc-finger
MEHNEFRLLVQSSLLGEISEDEQKLLTEHLKTCSDCRTELKQQHEILALINKQKKPEVNENLLREARAQLRGALRSQTFQSKWSFIEKFVSFISTPPKLALGAIALLLLGIFIGNLSFDRTENFNVTPNVNNIKETNFTGLQSDVRIRNVSFIDADASDGEIEFTFDAVKPVHIKGRVDDPMIQNVLTYSMLNEQNPGSRLNSINAIYSDKKVSVDKDFKNAIITVMMSDNNPGIRREAFKIISQVNYDKEIKDALLYVLVHDSSSALRIDALNYLINSSKKGVALDDQDLKSVKQKVLVDNNNYIRLKTKTLLEEYK